MEKKLIENSPSSILFLLSKFFFDKDLKKKKQHFPFWIVVNLRKLLGIHNGTMLGEGTFHPIKNPSETAEELPSFCFLTIFFLLLYFLSVRTFQLSQSTVLHNFLSFK